MWCDYLEYSTDWGAAGPLFEEAGIDFARNLARSNLHDNDRCIARLDRAHRHPTRNVDWYAPAKGPDRLTAGLRCFVKFKLGETVEVPEELTC